MAAKPDPFMIDDENPEWTAQSAAEARPFADLFPGRLAPTRRDGGTGASPEPIDGRLPLWLAADVVESLRATGSDFGARAERVLRDALANGRF